MSIGVSSDAQKRATHDETAYLIRELDKARREYAELRKVNE